MSGDLIMVWMAQPHFHSTCQPSILPFIAVTFWAVSFMITIERHNSDFEAEM
jgi:hypothetical protein